VTTLVLDRVRQEVLACDWSAGPRGPFAGPACLATLYHVLTGVGDLNAERVADQSQLHASLLGYYRALLLKEKVARRCRTRVARGVGAWGWRARGLGRGFRGGVWGGVWGGAGLELGRG
jgi:hypothetical protein